MAPGTRSKPDEARADLDDRGVRASTFEIGGETVAVISLAVGPPASLLCKLTPAEREVVGLALEGLSNREIGERRRRAERTIANQLASAFRKLGVVSRQELYALASVAAGDPVIDGADD